MPSKSSASRTDLIANRARDKREKEKVSFSPSKSIKLKTRSGLELTVDYSIHDGKLETKVYDGSKYIGGVDVVFNKWTPEPRAKVDISVINFAYRGKGIGTALYPIVNDLCKKHFKTNLTSDNENSRSDLAEKLWKRLVSLNLAEFKPKEQYYVMEKINLSSLYGFKRGK